MDLGFALQARCLEAVANHAVGADHAVVPVPRAIDEAVANAFLEVYRGVTPEPRGERSEVRAAVDSRMTSEVSSCRLRGGLPVRM